MMINQSFLFVLVIIIFKTCKNVITSEQILTSQTITFFIDSGVENKNEKTNLNLLIHRQNFNQSTINYCNFDPFLLNSKRKPTVDNTQIDPDTLSNSFDLAQNDLDDLKVNSFMSNYIFNESSQITVNVQFKNKQAESSKLWYLLEAKSVCTNQVLGVWRLKQHKNTDTIYCFNPDDTLFGHKSKIEDTLFQQIWSPVNTFEDVYFVLAIFTEEIYSDLNPTYYLVSSPILKYKNKNKLNLINDDINYDIKCSRLNDFNFFKTSTSTTTTTTLDKIKSTKIMTYYQDDQLTSSTIRTQFNRVNRFKTDRAILVDLVGNLNTCSNLSFDSITTEKIRSKLENIYKKLTNFKQLEIVNIVNKNCTSDDSLKRNLNTQKNVIFQHYVLFDEPIKNETKLYLVNILKRFLLTSPRIDNLDLIDSYLPTDNGTRLLLKSLNNSCDLYDYFSICQNGATCQLNANLAPTCVCHQTNSDNFYWSGKFCDVKVDQTIDSDKIKMFITIGCLASFAIISLLSLLIYVIYKKQKQKEIIKRVINERSKIFTSSSNETSINDEYPRLNNYNSNLNTISYPRELVIASSPIKKYQLNNNNNSKSNETDQTSTGNSNSKKSSEQYAGHEHAHINYAYNLTFNSNPFENDTFKKRPNNYLAEKELSLSSISSNSNFNLKAFWKNDPSSLDNMIHQKSNLFKNDYTNERKLEVTKIINNIPFSFEKQMARNFQNLTNNSSPANSSSLDTGSSDFMNRYSKYTDTTSIASTNQSLKDEDAWLPILNLAEEQILKYQSEEAKDMEYCLM